MKSDGYKNICMLFSNCHFILIIDTFLVMLLVLAILSGRTTSTSLPRLASIQREKQEEELYVLFAREFIEVFNLVHTWSWSSCKRMNEFEVEPQICWEIYVADKQHHQHHHAQNRCYWLFLVHCYDLYIRFSIFFLLLPWFNLARHEQQNHDFLPICVTKWRFLLKFRQEKTKNWRKWSEFVLSQGVRQRKIEMVGGIW